MENDKKQDNKRREDAAINAGLVGAQTEVVKRYGAAVKEHFVSYSGVDNEAGKTLAKGLKEISESNVNPNYRDINVKQQAGFSAEVKTVARENAEKIVRSEKTSRVTRTDDMVKQSDGYGRTVGGKNEQLYDIAEIDKNGGYIEGSARQLKYVGGDSKECTAKLLSKKFDKYRDANVPLEVPSDYYDSVREQLEGKSNQLRAQIERAEASGNQELAAKHREQLERVEATKRNLRKGALSNQEAIEARLHPKLSVAKDVAKLSHEAGVEGAKSGAVLGGGVSAIQNIVAVVKGDKQPEEAAVSVLGDTVKAAGVSYATAFTGSAIQGAMQNGSSQYVRALSKTNLPAQVAVSALEVGKTLGRYCKGEIDGTQCLTELGEKGTGMLASSAGAAVGQILIPIPVVGGLVGGMVGYALSTAYYNSLVTALNEAKFAHAERLRIEAECSATIAVLEEYRLEIELAMRNYLAEYSAAFQTALGEITAGLTSGNANAVINGANKITRKLGGKPLFDTKQQFDELMKNPKKIMI